MHSYDQHSMILTLACLLSYHSMGSVEDQADTANTVPLFSVYNIKFDYLFDKVIPHASCFAMVVWLPWKDMRIKNRSCCCRSMEYTRVMTIPGPLLKCCNKSFRTCAKVMYNTCGILFPQTRTFTPAYLFIHRRGREPYWRMFKI